MSPYCKTEQQTKLFKYIYIDVYNDIILNCPDVVLTVGIHNLEVGRAKFSQRQHRFYFAY